MTAPDPAEQYGRALTEQRCIQVRRTYARLAARSVHYGVPGVVPRVFPAVARVNTPAVTGHGPAEIIKLRSK